MPLSQGCKKGHASSGRCEPRAECMPVFGPRLAREAGVLRIVMVPRRAAPPLTWPSSGATAEVPWPSSCRPAGPPGAMDPCFIGTTRTPSPSASAFRASATAAIRSPRRSTTSRSPTPQLPVLVPQPSNAYICIPFWHWPRPGCAFTLFVWWAVDMGGPRRLYGSRGYGPPISAA